MDTVPRDFEIMLLTTPCHYDLCLSPLIAPSSINGFTTVDGVVVEAASISSHLERRSLFAEIEAPSLMRSILPVDPIMAKWSEFSGQLG